MRLIDADALIEQMKGMNMLFSPKIVIDNMPTAYDIDKVVEELKTNSEGYQKYYYPDEDYECGFENGCEYAFGKAIEIVKQGLKEQK